MVRLLALGLLVLVVGCTADRSAEPAAGPPSSGEPYCLFKGGILFCHRDK